MNSNTGQVYRGELDILLAKERGEPIVEVSEDVADAVEVGMNELRTMNRHERRKALKKARSNNRTKGQRHA